MQLWAIEALGADDRIEGRDPQLPLDILENDLARGAGQAYEGRRDRRLNAPQAQ